MARFTVDNKHYLAIAQFYGCRRTQRSQVPLIAHVDEGLAILDAIGASTNAREAFCLHPLLQRDDDLVRSRQPGSILELCSPDPRPLMLAMEYRRCANAYLSHHFRSEADVVALSAEPEVNDMLVADKVQNRKDFEIHHLHTHQDVEILVSYFGNWLRALGITEQRYIDLRRILVG